MATGSTGNCYICGAELPKIKMKNHLLKEHGEKDGGQTCFLLKIEGAYDKDYWFYADVSIHKTLLSVDCFMRKMWLECCGHMSAFYINRYSEVAKNRKWITFSVGDKLMHRYDFGSTTECVITIVGVIERSLHKEDVRLLARNIPPQFKCKSCGEPAEYLCSECAWGNNDDYYCSPCSEVHEHDDMMIPITNSPRMGECGYDGESDTFDFYPGMFLQKK